MAAWKLAPALAAGNTVRAQALGAHAAHGARARPLDRSRWAFPRASSTSSRGPGPAAGEELAESRRVDKIAFTGGTVTGPQDPRGRGDEHQEGDARARRQEPEHRVRRRRLRGGRRRRAASRLSRTRARSARRARGCSSSARIHDRFVEAMVAKVPRIKLGHGLDRGHEDGPARLGGAPRQGRVATSYWARGGREARLRRRAAEGSGARERASSSSRPSSSTSRRRCESRARRSSGRCSR